MGSYVQVLVTATDDGVGEPPTASTTLATAWELVGKARRNVLFQPGDHGALAGGDPNVAIVVEDGDPVPVPPEVLAEDRWRHRGWDWQPGIRGDAPETITQDWIVTALYEVALHTLAVENGTGSGTYPEDAEITVAAPIRPGLVFVNWTAAPSRFDDNLGDASDDETSFVMPGQNVVLTANYVFLDPAWSMDLRLAGAIPTRLTFGVHQAATEGWDEGLDAAGPAPAQAPRQACLASPDLALAYATDFQPFAEMAEFLLIATASADTPVTVDWDAPVLPEGKFLTIYEVLLDGIGAGREPVGRTLVGDTALVMDTAGSIEIPAGETRCYAIHYGSEVLYDLPLAHGWNLASLPVDPLVRSADDVLADGLGGTVHEGTVQQWDGSGYLPVTDLYACIGYWIYVPHPAVVLVRGLPVPLEELELQKGWHLRGVPTACQLPSASRDDITIWNWNAATLRYDSVHVLLPGKAYWFRVWTSSAIQFVEP